MRLAELGSAAQAAVPALQYDDDRWVRGESAAALAEIAGPDAIPALIRAVNTDDDPEVATAAASALPRIGPSAIPALVEALPSGGCIAGQGLAEIGSTAVPALLAVLRIPPIRGHRMARIGATCAVKSLAPDTTATVQALMAAMEDSDPGVRWHVLDVLRVLENNRVLALPTLLVGPR
jgi:HEAT repeat protein